ncbi:hypothetical protein F5Y17DRAFT_84493 [Xylariaceae sp. FL0594]|nr:hypothetical protein F5Y17DRAFT_84493 [Xylariaceae sp. FL0594]
MSSTGIDGYGHQEEALPVAKGVKASALRLWPRPNFQAYCLEHFLVECEIYHAQENERYKKLVARSRAIFLAKQNKKQTTPPVPTRRQPSRRAKVKPAAVEPARTARGNASTEMDTSSFKPARLERAFGKSPEGAVVRVLSDLHQKLGLDCRWEEYRSSLEDRIRETLEGLRGGEGSGCVSGTARKPELSPHARCIFSGPLGLRCRYCGFSASAPSDEASASGAHATTPRILASPAAMHSIEPWKFRSGSRSRNRDGEVIFHGIEFFVDGCPHHDDGDTAASRSPMIVLAGLKGILELGAELNFKLTLGEAGEGGAKTTASTAPPQKLGVVQEDSVATFTTVTSSSDTGDSGKGKTESVPGRSEVTTRKKRRRVL